MSDVVSACVDALAERASGVRVWPKGCLHPGGPHYRLTGMASPISMGEDELALLAALVELVQPERAFMIGNAFGLSGAVLARALAGCGGTLTTLDAASEGDGPRCDAVARQLREHLGLEETWRIEIGWSPLDVPRVVEEPVQLCIIDGEHSHPQVTRDLEACLPHLTDDAVVVWHDHWIPGIPESVAVARERGFFTWWLPTSCEVVLGTRDPERFEALRARWPEGAEVGPVTPGHRALWAVFRVLLGHTWERVFGRPALPMRNSGDDAR